MAKSAGEQVSGEERDRKIGMGSNITRRDILNGFSVAVGGTLLLPDTKWFERFGLPQSPSSPEKSSSYYPPTLTGMRGLYPASFSTAHALRDHTFWNNHADQPSDTGERYDLVIVGGGEADSSEFAAIGRVEGSNGGGAGAVRRNSETF